jgi:hypothetical protein
LSDVFLNVWLASSMASSVPISLVVANRSVRQNAYNNFSFSSFFLEKNCLFVRVTTEQEAQRPSIGAMILPLRGSDRPAEATRVA